MILQILVIVIIICAFGFLLYDRNDKQTKIDIANVEIIMLKKDIDDYKIKTNKYEDMIRFLIIYLSVLNTYLLNSGNDLKIREINKNYANELLTKYTINDKGKSITKYE
jgi:hypothetical protein